MQRSALGLVLLAANLAYSLTLPLEEEAAPRQINVTAEVAPHEMMGETQISSAVLQPSPSSYMEQSKSADDLSIGLGEKEENDTAEIKESAKSEPVADIESDYSFLPDKMPDLPDDEYLEIGDDGTPFNFLKSRDNQRLVKGAASQKTPAAAASPIYITVPIYINTAAGLPLQLSIGGQQVPLTPTRVREPTKAPEAPPSTNAKEVSPTSQFNRLLNHEDSISTLIATEQQKMSLRGSNRHRSHIRSTYGGRKQQQQLQAAPPSEFRNIGAYSIYI